MHEWEAHGPAGKEIAIPLPPALWRDLLDDELRARGLSAELQPTGDTLLARGAPAALAFLEEASASIEALDERWAIELELELRSSAKADSAGGAGNEGEAAAPAWSRSLRLRSGERASLGEREPQAFLGDWQVDVAADSGVADPQPWIAETGRSLELWAARLPGGRSVAIDGLLDLAELDGLDELDPETPDLGLLQLPRIACVQVAFSGVVDVDRELVVSIDGAPLPHPNWSLVIRVRESAAGEPPVTPWQVFDLAFLERPAWELAAFEPGIALEPPRRETSYELFGALAPNLLAGLAVSGAHSQRSPSFSNSLLFVPASETALAKSLQDLALALLPAHTTTHTLTIAQGALRARFPVRSGRVARFFAGLERRLLVDYQTELAPQTWMAGPRLERCFDGIACQGELALAAGSAPAWNAWAWISRTIDIQTLSRTQVGLGRIDLPRRSMRAAARPVRAGSGPQGILPAEGGADALVLELSEH